MAPFYGWGSTAARLEPLTYTNKIWMDLCYFWMMQT